MVIFDRFFMKVRIKNSTSMSFKTFMWRDIFSVSFSRELFVTLPHPFMEASCGWLSEVPAIEILSLGSFIFSIQQRSYFLVKSPEL